MAAAAVAGWVGAASAEPLAVFTVAKAGAAGVSVHEGVVEAVRQTVIAPQVPGAITALPVKAGDAVKTGQVLARLDARAAQQAAAAGDAQVSAARAAQEAATREVERQRALHARQYISQAALDRAEAQFKATSAQVAAQLAQAGASHTQSGFYTLTAPYAGVVSEVTVVQGDMAMPGRALMTVHDPAAMRVTAPLPQGVALALQGSSAPAVRLEIPGLAADKSSVTPVRVTVLPAADAVTHTMNVRFDLPAGLALAPGMFARVRIEGAPASTGATQGNPLVPASAVVRRAELAGVYVLGEDGRPMLRQVRLGRRQGDNVEVAAGLAGGERIARDAQVAARAGTAGK
jgi:RND family efflux transporter MFP subunit